MANFSEPVREYPSTYFVQDRANLDEMTRQNIQDQMLTAGMGGVLPEQKDLIGYGMKRLPVIFKRK